MKYIHLHTYIRTMEGEDWILHFPYMSCSLNLKDIIWIAPSHIIIHLVMMYVCMHICICGGIPLCNYCLVNYWYFVVWHTTLYVLYNIVPTVIVHLCIVLTCYNLLIMLLGRALASPTIWDQWWNLSSCLLACLSWASLIWLKAV